MTIILQTRVLEQATTSYSGRRLMIYSCRCLSCDYRHEETTTIPRIQESSSSVYSGSGSSDSGSSSCDSGGGDGGGGGGGG